jgi:serine/threonine protein kinase
MAGGKMNSEDMSTVLDVSEQGVGERTSVTDVNSHQGPRTAVLPPEPPRNSTHETPTVGVGRLRYEEMEALGSGGAGDVFLVKDHDIGRQVALKRLRAGSQMALRRFTREIRSLGRLEHPGIVPIHDVGIDQDGHFFFVMKHLRGETLAALLARLKTGDTKTHEMMTFAQRFRICQSILAVVDYAHGQGIIHRDLKPSNIMLGTHGEVVVVDWGLAVNVVDDDAPSEDELSTSADESDGSDSLKTQQGSILGTPRYMAPEQAAGESEQIDERSDLYSLAVIFYELFALVHPLGEERSLMDTLQAVIEYTPKPAYTYSYPFQDRVPTELGHFFSRAMSKPRDSRFQTAAEMAQEMEAVQTGVFTPCCANSMARRVLYKALHHAGESPLGFVVVSYTLTALLLAALIYFLVTVF